MCVCVCVCVCGERDVTRLDKCYITTSTTFFCHSNDMICCVVLLLLTVTVTVSVALISSCLLCFLSQRGSEKKELGHVLSPVHR